MGLQIGIVGLPNVGKSTLFNALTRSQKAMAANFPFCTIDPNVGIVEVPDSRLEALAKIISPQRVVHSAVEFVDIAGLVAGASTGEGLGNKFLSHIRECDAVAHVVRAFESSEIHHVSGNIDPKRDLEVIMTELGLSDLESIVRQMEKLMKKVKSGDKESQMALDLLERIKVILEAGGLASQVELKHPDKEKPLLKSFNLLTAKPYLVIANIAESQIENFDEMAFRASLGIANTIPLVPICAKIEEEIGQLEMEEARLFLDELGIATSGLERLVRQSFELLGLQNYFTAGVQEVRSWTIHKGDTAPKAAGVIHTDFEKGFIKAEVISYSDYVTYGGESGSKEKGKMRLEGKEYIVQDGDVMHFKFNV